DLAAIRSAATLLQPAAPSSQQRLLIPPLSPSGSNINNCRLRRRLSTAAQLPSSTIFPDSDAEDEDAASRGPSAAAARPRKSSSGTSSQVLSVPGYPPFELGKSRFDQYRAPTIPVAAVARHFFNVIDPGPCLKTDLWSAALQSTAGAEAFKSGCHRVPDHRDETWGAPESARTAILHPDTWQENLSNHFACPASCPTAPRLWLACLLPPQPACGTTVFWQWLNQSHNAAVNYANRNASKETPVSRFLYGYVGALRPRQHAKRAANAKAASYPKALKCSTKIAPSGRHIKVAALRERKFSAPRFPRLHLPVHAPLVVTAALCGALPVAIALSPQISAIAPEDLEPELQAT
uniref:SCP domain-containing protein n=1 Tax=Macrostomum lignano TaxID=282301 RepID=A0A1I8JPH4_9PLAT